MEKSVQELWDIVVSVIEKDLNKESFEIWFRPIKPLTFENGIFTIQTPNRFFSDWIRENCQNKIEQTIFEQVGSIVSLDYQVAQQIEDLNTSTVTVEEPAKEETGFENVEFNPKYVFDNFVVGPSNRFAFACSEAVAKEPAKAFNPLFVYGGVGLGKTHLLHGIGHHIKKELPNLKVMYVTSEKFINDYIDSIRSEKIPDFRNKYRSLDCILIDDIQFFVGKQSSQQEFFYTFNTLFDLKKQIVITSDRPPKELPTLEERLISRFEWGVVADIKEPECPVRKQAVPSLDEFKSSIHDLADPCGEEKDTVLPGLVHRYPDRVLFLLTDACATYCRHCTRRRMVGSRENALTASELNAIYEYLGKNKKVRDVLISGGDPFLVSDERLEEVLKNLRAIPHIEVIRFGTRLPVFLPQRFTPKLVSILKKYQPIYMSIHFNHPKEISEATKQACAMLSDSGIPLGSQTVLLKGINDTPKVMAKLMHELLKIRVRPYYLYQCDLAAGTEHLRTSIASGIRIINSLRGFTSGYAVPTYVIDAPGGGGKVPIGQDYIISRTRKEVIFQNYEGKAFVYPEKNGSSVSGGEIPVPVKVSGNSKNIVE